MNRREWWVGMVLAAALIGTGALAARADNSAGSGRVDFFSGLVVLNECRAALEMIEHPSGPHAPGDLTYAAGCVGRLTTFTGFLFMAQAKGWIKGKDRICFPQNSNNEQAMRVAKKWLEDHPDKLAQDGARLLYEAFHDAFPCAD